MGRYFQPSLLDGKVALVTGGATGIGLVAARSLAQLGAHVVLASRNEERLRKAVAELEAEGLSATWRQLNIRDPDQVFEGVDWISATHGPTDILVNNAGGQFPIRAEDLTPGGWRAVVDLNLNGTFYCCLAAGRQMIANGGGKIINIVLSVFEGPTTGMVHSGAARAGVVQMSRTLAAEWATHNIQINSLGPLYLSQAARSIYGEEVAGVIADSTPARRWATPDELGAAVVVLASPFSDYMTGVLLPLDGGNSLTGGIRFRGSAVLPEEGDR